MFWGVSCLGRVCVWGVCVSRRGDLGIWDLGGPVASRVWIRCASFGSVCCVCASCVGVLRVVFRWCGVLGIKVGPSVKT